MISWLYSRKKKEEKQQVATALIDLWKSSKIESWELALMQAEAQGLDVSIFGSSKVLLVFSTAQLMERILFLHVYSLHNPLRIKIAGWTRKLLELGIQHKLSYSDARRLWLVEKFRIWNIPINPNSYRRFHKALYGNLLERINNRGIIELQQVSPILLPELD